MQIPAVFVIWHISSTQWWFSPLFGLGFSRNYDWVYEVITSDSKVQTNEALFPYLAPVMMLTEVIYYWYIVMTNSQLLMLWVNRLCTDRQRPPHWSCPAVRPLLGSGPATSWRCQALWWWWCHRHPCRIRRKPPWTLWRWNREVTLLFQKWLVLGRCSQVNRSLVATGPVLTQFTLVCCRCAEL